MGLGAHRDSIQEVGGGGQIGEMRIQCEDNRGGELRERGRGGALGCGERGLQLTGKPGQQLMVEGRLGLAETFEEGGLYGFGTEQGGSPLKNAGAQGGEGGGVAGGDEEQPGNRGEASASEEIVDEGIGGGEWEHAPAKQGNQFRSGLEDGITEELEINRQPWDRGADERGGDTGAEGRAEGESKGIGGPAGRGAAGDVGEEHQGDRHGEEDEGPSDATGGDV